MRILLLLLVFPFIMNAQEKKTNEFEMKEGDTVYTMKQYFICFYQKGPNRAQDSATVVKLQQGHLEHIGLMAKKGAVNLAGPMGDDGNIRGILIFNVSTKEEAEEWVKKDPMVIAGRLTYEIHPWWCAKGSSLK